jgi:phage FluMu protein Com
MIEIRCKKCNKLLGKQLEGSVDVVCPRCGVFNHFDSKKNIK